MRIFRHIEWFILQSLIIQTTLGRLNHDSRVRNQCLTFHGDMSKTVVILGECMILTGTDWKGGHPLNPCHDPRGCGVKNERGVTGLWQKMGNLWLDTRH